MVAISFSVFKEKIIDDTKKQTIRRPRKHPINVGDKLQLYWKLRTKETELLKEVICKEVISIDIYDILFDEVIAKNDGFDNAFQMRDFFYSHYSDILDKHIDFVIIKW